MFGRKSLDQILSGFNTLKVELHDHIQHQSNEIGRKRQEVADLNTQITEHDASVTRAQRVLTNIDNIIAA